MSRAYDLLKRGLAPAKPHIARRLGPRYPEWVDWVKRRATAPLDSLFRGSRVMMRRPDLVRLEPFEDHGPHENEVIVRSILSALSQGTELAVLERRPNPGARLPFVPGYQAVGTVVATGVAVAGLEPGDRVAAVMPHASVARLSSTKVVRLPPAVDDVSGAFFQLGVVAWQGIRRARLQGGETVAVLGRGVVGQLALQIAHGLGCRCWSLARTERWSDLAAPFADRVMATEEGGAPSPTSCDVVIDATGDPRALHSALRLCRVGGRVVLLGSSRGVTRGLDLGWLADREIQVVGAHTSTLDRDPSAPEGWHAAVGRFLDGVEAGTLVVASLVELEVDPREAGWLYAGLSRGDLKPCGAVFRWDLLDDARRWRPARRLEAPEAVAAPGLEDVLAANAPADAPPAHSPGLSSPLVEPNRKLGMAVVGCGARGVLDARAVVSSPNARLVTVTDPDGAAATDLAARHGVQPAADFDDVLANPNVEAVFLASPHHVHAAQALRALDAGKHVLVEKPLATTLDDAEAVVARSRQLGLGAVTWLGTRYWPRVAAARKVVEAGALGRLLGGQLTLLLSKSPAFWQRGEVPGGSDWRTRWETSGGGVLMISGIHYLDWIRFLGGEEVAEVSATLATQTAPAEVEDAASGWLRLEGGALVTFQVSASVPGLDFQLLELSLWGTDGHLRLSPTGDRVYTTRKVEGLETGRWQRLDPAIGLRSAAVETVDRFAASILRGGKPEIDELEGLAVQRLLDAIYRSGQSGRPVRPGGDR